MQTMREYIKEVLVNVHLTATTDGYGQIGKFNFGINSLFKDKAEEVLEYNKLHHLFRVNTYGASYGTYKAIYDITDIDIKTACSIAYRKNENRLRNINRW
jgi:hypothetical protein